jgi:hypothetical protein
MRAEGANLNASKTPTSDSWGRFSARCQFHELLAAGEKLRIIKIVFVKCSTSFILIQK